MTASPTPSGPGGAPANGLTGSREAVPTGYRGPDSTSVIVRM